MGTIATNEGDEHKHTIMHILMMLDRLKKPNSENLNVD